MAPRSRFEHQHFEGNRSYLVSQGMKCHNDLMFCLASMAPVASTNHCGFLSTHEHDLADRRSSGFCGGAGFQSFAEQCNRIFRYLVFNPSPRCLAQVQPFLAPLPSPLQGMAEGRYGGRWRDKPCFTINA